MSVAGILASRSKGLLLGEGVNPDQLADIRRRVESDPAVERAGDILTMYSGPPRTAREHGGCASLQVPQPSRCTRRSAASKPTCAVHTRRPPGLHRGRVAASRKRRHAGRRGSEDGAQFLSRHHAGGSGLLAPSRSLRYGERIVLLRQ